MVTFIDDRLLDSGKKVDVLAVAVIIHDSYAHSAITYRSDDGDVYMLDYMGTHVANNKYEDKRGREKYLHAVPMVSRGLLIGIRDYLAVAADEIADHTPAYGLSYIAGTIFDAESRQFSFPENAIGFTCSGFVMAFLGNWDIHLLDMANWGMRPNDYDKWRELDMVDFARSKKHEMFPPELCDKLEKQIPVHRATPENVAGAAACHSDDWPLNFDAAEEAGGKVKERFGYEPDEQVPYADPREE